MLDRLQKAIGYTFGNPQIATTACTHCSASTDNNQRLEFIGDGMVNFVVGYELFLRHDAPEGKLSEYRKALVSGSNLARVADGLGLGEFLCVSAGQLVSDAMKADLYEAIVGAILVDGGVACAHDFVARTISGLDTLPSRVIDFKTELQEFVARHRLGNIVYAMLGVDGAPHMPCHKVSVSIGGEIMATGSSSRKKEAEQVAAGIALERLKANI